MCRHHHPAHAPPSHNARTGHPRGAPAVCSPGYEAGRRRAIGVVAVLPATPRDHADGATLGRRDAKASRRPRRPALRAWSGTTAATGTVAVSVSVGDRTHPHRYTTIAGGTPALQSSQHPLLRPRFADDGNNPRRHSSGRCDAGMLGRHCVPASQKAGDRGAGSVAVSVSVPVAVSDGCCHGRCRRRFRDRCTGHNLTQRNTASTVAGAPHGGRRD